MRIIFAKNISFCSGVKRASKIAEESFKRDPKPIQFLGNLVHNELVMKDLAKKGGKIISNSKGIQRGTLITKAHGMPPGFKRGIPRSVLIKDTTCPLVKNAQLKARALFKNSYQVIIIADKNHPEPRGIMGYTGGTGIIIESQIQAKAPQFLKKIKNKKIAVIAQTTQNLDKVNQILKILRGEAKRTKWFNTICPEVANRQKELSQIIKRVDGILVIGSRSSANTNQLIEIVKKSKKPLWRIDSLEELKKIEFGNISVLGVVSGTSTPDWEIKKIKKWLKEEKQK